MAGRPLTPEDAWIGATLRRLRKQAGMTQTQLGRCADVSAQPLGKIERGENKLAAKHCRTFSAHLGVSMYDLVGGSPGCGNATGFAESAPAPYAPADAREPAAPAVIASVKSLAEPFRSEIFAFIARIHDGLLEPGSSRQA